MPQSATRQASVLSQNQINHQMGQTLTQQRRAKQLIRFLPYGCLSREMFDIISENDTVMRHKFVAKGFIEKRKMMKTTVNRKTNKYDYYYLLTPAGLNYILRSGLKLPMWIRGLEEHEITIGRNRTAVSENEFAHLMISQDMIAFFSMTNSNTLLSEMWNMSTYAKRLTQLISNSRYMTDDVLTAAVSSFSFYYDSVRDRNEEEKNESSVCFADINRMIQELNPSHERHSGFVSSSEINFLNRQLQSKEKTESGQEKPMRYRDSICGIYTGTYQDFSVYRSNQDGARFSSANSTSSRFRTRMYASIAALDNSRRMDCQCTSAMIITRTLREFINTILDPYNLRTIQNKQFGSAYDHTYIIPAVSHGMHLVNFLDTKINPASNKEPIAKAKLALTVAGETTGLTLDASETIIKMGDQRVYNGVLFALEEIYECMSEAEIQNCKLPIICSLWQEEYFKQLETFWLKYPILDETKLSYPNQSSRQYGFELIIGKNLTTTWNTWSEEHFKTPLSQYDMIKKRMEARDAAVSESSS